MWPAGLSACARFATGLLLVAAGVEAALPAPPKQHAPWRPVADNRLPEYLVKVAATLFETGLADPRDGEYREVELVVSRGRKDSLRTHAWVFSGDHAVCWDGLVYRVRAVGGAADLEKDVRAIADAPSNGPETAFWSDIGGGRSAAPTAIALLLRLNRPELAAPLWQPSGEGEWLATAVTAWFGSAYKRLVGAFEGGADQEALDVAESLLTWQSRAPAAWRAPNPWEPRRAPDLSFLEPVPALLADSRRRLRAPARLRADLRQPPADRIANLIDRLDEVRGSKLSIPGPLLFSFDPVYEALAKEGEAAVDALVDAWENDGRLTRTFDYSRPWSLFYRPVPVRDVVRLLLGDILGLSFGVHGSTPAELRGWWRRNRSSSKAKRSLELLADDRAGPDRWLESANFLTMRSDVEHADGFSVSRVEACDPKKEPPPMFGEALRASQGARVSDLLAKRTTDLVALDSDRACRMAVDAVLWDPKSSSPAARMAATLRSCRANGMLAVARLSIGDPGAAAEWVAEIHDRAKWPPLTVRDLAPLWMFPDDPVLQQAAEFLFSHPESLFSPVAAPESIYFPLLVIPLYRQAVLGALGDQRIVGTATRSEGGMVSFHRASGPGGGSSEPDHDQGLPIRGKDMVAWLLSSLEGAPKFQFDWPQPDRDAIIAELASYLRAHEAELRAFPARLQDVNCPGERLYLHR